MVSGLLSVNARVGVERDIELMRVGAIEVAAAFTSIALACE